jgi:hypothetical protein
MPTITRVFSGAERVATDIEVRQDFAKGRILSADAGVTKV